MSVTLGFGSECHCCSKFNMTRNKKLLQAATQTNEAPAKCLNMFKHANSDLHMSKHAELRALFKLFKRLYCLNIATPNVFGRSLLKLQCTLDDGAGPEPTCPSAAGVDCPAPCIIQGATGIILPFSSPVPQHHFRRQLRSKQ